MSLSLYIYQQWMGEFIWVLSVSWPLVSLLSFFFLVFQYCLNFYNLNNLLYYAGSYSYFYINTFFVNVSIINVSIWVFGIFMVKLWILSLLRFKNFYLDSICLPDTFIANTFLSNGF